jgi:hypothetical protein
LFITNRNSQCLLLPNYNHQLLSSCDANTPKIIPARFTPDFPLPESITGWGDPRSMVPVRLAGAEVTEAFWAKLAVVS